MQYLFFCAKKSSYDRRRRVQSDVTVLHEFGFEMASESFFMLLKQGSPPGRHWAIETLPQNQNTFSVDKHCQMCQFVLFTDSLQINKI